jgi:hypothetical protein
MGKAHLWGRRGGGFPKCLVEFVSSYHHILNPIFWKYSTLGKKKFPLRIEVSYLKILKLGFK